LGKIKFLIFSSVLFLALISGLAQIRAQADKYRIDNVTLRDETGAPKSSFARGSFILIEVTITNIMSYTYAAEPFIVIMRMTIGSTMWGIGFFPGSALSGESKSGGSGILIPNNAPTGTYSMTVFVWSDWAFAGGYPIASSSSVTFTVTM